MSTDVKGRVAPGFEKLRDVFAEGFEADPGMGAALSVWHEGEEVVNLYGGYADHRKGSPWTEETATVVFSCTKGLVSILAAQLVQEGRLDYEAPVARYWPEFAQGGKGEITVAEALSHRAGLSAPRRSLDEEDILEWDRVVQVLEEQEPLWPRGAGYAYHALTHGWVAGEILRRVTGQSVGTLFEKRIAVPLRAGAWIGLPEARESQVAHVRSSPALDELWAGEAAKDSEETPNWPYRAMTLGRALPPELVTETGGFNDPRLLRAEIPGAGGIATARALAAIWSATVVSTSGVRLLGDEVLPAALTPMSSGTPVFEAPGPFPRWARGFQLDSEARRYLGKHSFGHDGAGGQSAFADQARRLGFAYVTNWMMGPEDTRATRLIETLDAAL